MQLLNIEVSGTKKQNLYVYERNQWPKVARSKNTTRSNEQVSLKSRTTHSIQIFPLQILNTYFSKAFDQCCFYQDSG